MVKFKSTYGKNLQEEELAAQAYNEEFYEKIAAEMLQAEPLDPVMSQAEAEEQDRKNQRNTLRGSWLGFLPDGARQPVRSWSLIFRHFCQS